METEENTQKKEPKTHSDSKNHSRYLGLFLIVGSLTLLTLWFAYDFLPFHTQKLAASKTAMDSKKSGLQTLWEKDIKEMLKGEIFHKGITSIRKVRVFMLDQNLHSQFKYLKAPFKQKSDGQNLLEVSFMSHHSDLEKAEKLIVQYNLTDKDSGNMFWEHSRTITIPEEMLAN